MPEYVHVVFGLGVVAFGFALMVSVAKLIIGPISQAAGLLRAPTRFQLSDFIWLVMQIQVVLAVATRLDQTNHSAFGFVLFFALAATLAMWVAAVSCVSKAHVVHPWRRGVFVLFLLPATVIIMVAFPISLGSSLMLSMQYFESAYLQATPSNGWQIVGYTALATLLAPLSLGLRAVSHWVLQGRDLTTLVLRPSIQADQQQNYFHGNG